jgi:acetylornithine deacetylase/succinyl-diaminopimelate desuccinylase-like protein
VPLVRDLAFLARAPDGRDCTQPSFRKTANWVAGRLEAQGVLPMGTGKTGAGRYLQAYRWDALKKKNVVSYNVIGLRPGSGDHKEAVVVMAHLDGITAHEKKANQIKRYQGANDNASGVAAVLHVSETLARLERRMGKRLERDVLFVFTSGEEAGLVGAEAFARFSKHLGGRKIVGAINFDSVGWGKLDDVKVYGGKNATAARANPVYRAAMRVVSKGTMARPGAGHKASKNYFKSSDQHAMASGGVPSVLYAAKVNDMMHSSRDTLGRLDNKTIYGTARHGLRTLLGMANHRLKKLPGATMPLKLENFAPWGPLRAAKVD